jgi:hypothetical protein
LDCGAELNHHEYINSHAMWQVASLLTVNAGWRGSNCDILYHPLLPYSIASNLLTTWDMPTPYEYNADALSENHCPLEIKGDPREINPFATQEQCDSTRCSD